MRPPVVLLAIAALAGCGLETATTAATGAAARKQEVEQGQKTQDQTRKKIDQTVDLMQQRSQQAGGSDSR